MIVGDFSATRDELHKSDSLNEWYDDILQVKLMTYLTVSKCPLSESMFKFLQCLWTLDVALMYLYVEKQCLETLENISFKIPSSKLIVFILIGIEQVHLN